ncbi:MAG: two-component system, NtrC family, nitrogen regulation sensor histidine kinase NtrY [Gemmatimonadaceae bacterium]|nr:two-component system, NtrC family, nitrogen regulation sensor histidine kinase NtrY [Gemmatimonadaceae bacterium]
MSAIPLFLVAIWVRTPAIPRTAGSPARNETERAKAAEGAVRALERSLSEALQRLDDRATGALDAPANVPEAFSFLDSRAPQRDGESVVLFDHNRALAWAGKTRIDPDSLMNQVSTTFSPFYTTLNVVKIRGDRRAVASVVLHAVPPADRLTESLDSRVAPLQGVSSYEFAPPQDARAGPVVLSYRGQPLLRALPRLADPGEVRFRSASTLRARGTIALVIFAIAFLGYAWRDRRSLSERLFAIIVAVGVTALVPWSSFSNTARVFDPAYYFSKLAGPLTANAAALSISSALVLIGVYAVIRAHPNARLPRLYAAIGALVSLGIGIPFASNIVRGIGQPPWGSTPGLWLSWEIPLFVFLFAILLATYWLLRMAVGKPGGVSFRAGVAIASISAIVALGGLWSTTLRQRMQLAQEDVAALGHVDDYVVLLARRFATDLAQSPPPKTRAALLQAYASSDLAAAEYPAMLGSWDDSGAEIAEFAVTDAQADSGVILKTVREAVATNQTVTRSVLGPSGVQILSAVKHPSGGVTSVLVFPRTRLLTGNPYAALLGMTSQSGGDPPYMVGLTDISPTVTADTARVQWHRLGDELHGDRLISTSAGTKRAHIEIDLRSVWARAERGMLVLLLDLCVAGFFWLHGALPEKGFVRWLRVRAGHWIYTYHARLTLALFAFFVIPAAAFAVWSYQRLRGDDLQTKEVLVHETLHAVSVANEYDQLPAAERRFETPLFLYSNGFLIRTSDSLLDVLAPAGRPLPAAVQLRLVSAGELTAASEEKLGPAKVLFGYSAALGPGQEHYVLAAPARSDDLVLDRRRRDLGMLVLFATAAGALAALWLSGIAAKRLARDLELSRIEVARAERVLAWGEMARQVAHEIKNPLTPIRLGVQHLRRARSDPRVDFDTVLNENVRRILAEIDRLDEIARSFSRYGSAPADLPPAVPVDVAAVVKDVMALEQMGDRLVKWQLRGADRPVWAMAQKDEMRDVLLNVFENARLAGARRVDVVVRDEDPRVTIETVDDGAGIAPGVLPRIFEPHFSTRTTGSGLGLAVSRRLIEAWGGEIGITSDEGRGTRVLIVLVRAEA